MKHIADLRQPMTLPTHKHDFPLVAIKILRPTSSQPSASPSRLKRLDTMQLLLSVSHLLLLTSAVLCGRFSKRQLSGDLSHAQLVKKARSRVECASMCVAASRACLGVHYSDAGLCSIFSEWWRSGEKELSVWVNKDLCSPDNFPTAAGDWRYAFNPVGKFWPEAQEHCRSLVSNLVEWNTTAKLQSVIKFH